jgi:XRE family transcriptional regulator, regulator of sulfur utilization
MDEDALSERFASNLKQLRDARGMTQQQMAKLAGLPRATWANLESGEANPTLFVLHRVALALQITIEELLSPQRASCEFYPRGKLGERTKGLVTVRRLLPDPIPGMAIERMELPPSGRMTGVPHTPGTREYLTCESGQVVLVAAGETWTLEEGDVVAFRGDQRHSYANLGTRKAIAYSIVVLAKLA